MERLCATDAQPFLRESDQTISLLKIGGCAAHLNSKAYVSQKDYWVWISD
jgi:hypothetical protein